MKILDEGPSDFHHEFTCEGCKAKLAAEAGDVTVGYFGVNYGGEQRSREYCVQCPRCCTNHKLNRDQIPLMVRLKADEQYNISRGGFKE